MRNILCPLAFSAAVSMSSLAFGSTAFAQDLDVSFTDRGGDGQAAWCASSVVAGLAQNGDGFLAVRAGPGTQYRKIGEIYNGDIVSTCDSRKGWVAIVYGPSRRKGWVNGKWLKHRAGWRSSAAPRSLPSGIPLRSAALEHAVLPHKFAWGCAYPFRECQGERAQTVEPDPLRHRSDSALTLGK